MSPSPSLARGHTRATLEGRAEVYLTASLCRAGRPEEASVALRRARDLAQKGEDPMLEALLPIAQGFVDLARSKAGAAPPPALGACVQSGLDSPHLVVRFFARMLQTDLG